MPQTSTSADNQAAITDADLLAAATRFSFNVDPGAHPIYTVNVVRCCASGAWRIMWTDSYVLDHLAPAQAEARWVPTPAAKHFSTEGDAHRYHFTDLRQAAARARREAAAVLPPW
ncbi:hypothetical protein [Planomonospora sp. ID82291]|uniref:hypothetical protein n=1 Tax=Planomonospora sp. ID82291 TaxID=2738136 RepID=UPI0018C44A3F|nr:hypothetical protein [Planomonospora sp. ID82291]MBG0818448.1 hypothetical protein [Planomonospora sp. ID82291]